CAGNKEDEKSDKVVDHFAKLDMFSFVDGKPGNLAFTRWIKKIIQKALLGGRFFRRLTGFIKWIVILLVVLSAGCFVFNFFSSGIAKWIGLGAAILLFIFIGIILFVFSRLKLIAKTGYGLNKGQAFHDWIKGLI